MTWFNYMQAMQKQENPEGDLGRALLRVTQLEAEVARLNKALDQVVEALEQSTIAMRHPLDDWKGNVEADALGLANAALNEYYAAKENR